MTTAGPREASSTVLLALSVDTIGSLVLGTIDLWGECLVQQGWEAAKPNNLGRPTPSSRRSARLACLMYISCILQAVL